MSAYRRFAGCSRNTVTTVEAEIVKLPGWFPHDGQPISLRCPSCRHVGMFELSPERDFLSDGNLSTGVLLGSRRCPNPDCHAHVFTVWSPSEGALVTSYPPETLDFDATNLPKAVLGSLEEAIRCHAAGCYRASALMVRQHAGGAMRGPASRGLEPQEAARVSVREGRCCLRTRRRSGHPSTSRQRRRACGVEGLRQRREY